MESRMLFIHALSPVHSGTGQAVDVIDLPIARERTTGWPYLPGSSIKGVLRDACFDGNDQSKDGSQLFQEAFGPPTARASDHAGALAFGDARILCMPVRSFAGTFAWTTCPMVLARLRRDYQSAALGEFPSFDSKIEYGQGAVVEGSKVVHSGKVYLEDLDVEVAQGEDPSAAAKELATQLFDDPVWQGTFNERFVVVSDDLFSYLCETCTEVMARIKMEDDTKTVQEGGLWYEEATPVETLFYSVVIARPRKDFKADDLFDLVAAKLDTPLQIGGNASVGRGLVKMSLRGGEKS